MISNAILTLKKENFLNGRCELKISIPQINRPNMLFAVTDSHCGRETSHSGTPRKQDTHVKSFQKKCP